MTKIIIMKALYVTANITKCSLDISNVPKVYTAKNIVTKIRGHVAQRWRRPGCGRTRPRCGGVTGGRSGCGAARGALCPSYCQIISHCKDNYSD